LQISTSKADINEAVVLYPHNGCTDIIKGYENELYSADDDYTGLSLVLVESQIESLVEEEEHHIGILNK